MTCKIILPRSCDLVWSNWFWTWKCHKPVDCFVRNFSLKMLDHAFTDIKVCILWICQSNGWWRFLPDKPSNYEGLSSKVLTGVFQSFWKIWFSRKDMEAIDVDVGWDHLNSELVEENLAISAMLLGANICFHLEDDNRAGK